MQYRDLPLSLLFTRQINGNASWPILQILYPTLQFPHLRRWGTMSLQITHYKDMRHEHLDEDRLYLSVRTGHGSCWRDRYGQLRRYDGGDVQPAAP
ncbi:protein of unknown function [Alcaligenes faecalis subsp. faecalis]|nr:protein of unknown function [Alcaligenes faecalis subsp. faecalis]